MINVNMKDITEAVTRALFHEKTTRSVVVWTGLRGKQTFDWHILGGSEHYTSQKPAKLIAQIPGRREVIDSNGEIWLWISDDGHIIWERQCATTRPVRRRQTRFIEWVNSLT